MKLKAAPVPRPPEAEPIPVRNLLTRALQIGLQGLARSATAGTQAVGTLRQQGTHLVRQVAAVPATGLLRLGDAVLRWSLQVLWHMAPKVGESETRRLQQKWEAISDMSPEDPNRERQREEVLLDLIGVMARMEQKMARLQTGQDELRTDLNRHTGSLRGDRLEEEVRQHLVAVFQWVYGSLFQAGDLSCRELFRDRDAYGTALAAAQELGLQDQLDLAAELPCDLLARIRLPATDSSFLVVVEAAVQMNQGRVRKAQAGAHRLAQALATAGHPESVLPCVVGEEFRPAALLQARLPTALLPGAAAVPAP